MKSKKITITVFLAIFLFLSMGSVYAEDTDEQFTIASENAVTDFSQADILNAATNVKTYTETNNKIPETVYINNNAVTMPQLLYLMTSSVNNVNQGSSASVNYKKVNPAPNPSENTRGGTLTKTAYLDASQRIKTFMDNNNHAPNFATTTQGTISFETQIYLFSRILSFYQNNNQLPAFATIIPGLKVEAGSSTPANNPPVVPPVTPEPEDPPVTPEPENPPVINPPTPDPVNNNFTLAQINAAATNVKKYYDTNKKLPPTITINNQQITLTQFLYLLTTATINQNTGKTTPITPKNINTPPNPSENAKQGTITKTAYLDLAQRIKTFMDNNNHAPNFATTTLGTTRYETQIYAFSRILDFYQTNKYLPNSVTIIPGIKINTGSSPPSQVTTTIIAQTSYGFVQKIESYGTGSNKVAIIIGVHPHELAVHVAMEDAIKAAQLNNIKLDIFQVVVYDGREMDESRNQGEYLASQYIVPLIDSSYQLVMDVHGNRGTYALTDFIFAPSQGALSTSFANQLIAKSNGLIGYLYIEGSSPPKITIPIAQKGIPTVLLELDWRFEQSVLLQKCKTIVAALDAIFA